MERLLIHKIVSQCQSCRVERKGPELVAQGPAGLEEGDTQEALSLGTCHIRNEQSRCRMHQPVANKT